jgi:predicted DCC family thiol-disulfide oxidoreductase YuxK
MLTGNQHNVLPRFFQDWIYDFVADNRYKWFEEKGQCLMPNGELLERFL